MDFRWSVENVRRNTADGGVITVFWKCTAVGVTDKYGKELYMASTLDFTPDPANPDFVPFDSLTEDFVLHWVWHEIKDDVEEEMTALYADRVIPDTSIGTPWAAA